MPQYTNKYNLPLPVFKALTKDLYDKKGDYSVTELIGPVKIGILKDRHKDDIVIEASDLLWSMRGESMHYIAQKAELPNSVIERRIIADVFDKELSMKADYIYPISSNQHELLDFKDTKVFVAKNGMIKSEWIWQSNIYRLMYNREMDLNITRMKNVLFLGDWKYAERWIKHAAQDENTQNPYPDIPIVVVDIPEKSESEILEYIKNRIVMFEDAKQFPDDELPDCTESERWADPSAYAVVKKTGNAVPGGKDFKTRADAEAFQESRWCKAEEKKTSSIKRGDTHIEYRRGESKRCERGYCPVREFCKQYKTEIRKDPF